MLKRLEKLQRITQSLPDKPTAIFLGVSLALITVHFQTISESKLKNADYSLDADTFICGDDQNTISKLTDLVHEIAGLRPVYLGPLSLSYQAEILTPMCLNAAKRNKIKNPGVKLV